MAYSFTRRIAGVDPQRAQDINDLQAAVENVGNVDLPGHADDIASGAALGHVKVGAGLSIDAGGVLSASAAAPALNDLTDVTITTPANTQVLTYNGTEWVNAAASGGSPAVEDWHEVGAAGEPAFQNAWTNLDPVTWMTAAFYKDPFGVVHLKGVMAGGTVAAGSTGTAFTLPVGYRPAKADMYATATNPSGTTSRIDIQPTGEVGIVTGNNGWMSISGITFRAA